MRAVRLLESCLGAVEGLHWDAILAASWEPAADSMRLLGVATKPTVDPSGTSTDSVADEEVFNGMERFR